MTDVVKAEPAPIGHFQLVFDLVLPDPPGAAVAALEASRSEPDVQRSRCGKFLPGETFTHTHGGMRY
jgi:hypothetical protein